MDKGRLEAFSDGVFSIVMTLLIFNIKVPVLADPVTNNALWEQLRVLSPHIIVYLGTFTVLSVFWINHHFLFHNFAKAIDRWLNLMNLAFLMFVAFVPFSADFIGSYPRFEVSDLLYGLNLIIIVLITIAMIKYIKDRPELLSEHISQRNINQAGFRGTLSVSSYVMGIAFAFINVNVSIFFYIIPIVFNIIPGSLDFTEKLFRFSLD